MSWSTLVVLLGTVAIGNTINRPVFKISLTQKGYAQFLQYDLDNAPMTEFTLCVWIRVFNFESEQTIFSYMVGSNRYLRLWLDADGQRIGVLINNRMRSSVPVDIEKAAWKHLCLSYQSDYGAWAVYLDSQLVNCEAARSLNGVTIPGGGTLIFGYGTAEDGSPSGLEGEVFGVSMIMSSTIQRNLTIRAQRAHGVKPISTKYKSKNDIDLGYVVLNDLMEQNINEKIEKPKKESSANNFEYTTPIIEPDVTSDQPTESNIIFGPRGEEVLDAASDKEFMDFSFDSKRKKNIFSWNSENELVKHRSNNLNRNRIYGSQPVVLNPSDTTTEQQGLNSQTSTFLPLSTELLFDKLPATESIYALTGNRVMNPGRSFAKAAGSQIKEIHGFQKSTLPSLSKVLKFDKISGMESFYKLSGDNNSQENSIKSTESSMPETEPPFSTMDDNYTFDLPKSTFLQRNKVLQFKKPPKDNFIKSAEGKISETELPPPPVDDNYTFDIQKSTLLPQTKDLQFEKLPNNADSIYNQEDQSLATPTEGQLSEIELPPPVSEDNNVYGQWTHSNYPNSVLNYLRNKALDFKTKKAPPTIPLHKLSDNFPYASEKKQVVFRPQPKLNRMASMNNFIHQQLSKSHVKKRNALYPEINVVVTKPDKRIEIMELHSKTRPKNVEITYRGQTQDLLQSLYKNISFQNDTLFDDDLESISYGIYGNGKVFAKQRQGPKITDISLDTLDSLQSDDQSHKTVQKSTETPNTNNDFYSSKSMISVLPFLKSFEYFTEDHNYTGGMDMNAMYTKSLSETDKWHNVMNYNPRYSVSGTTIRPQRYQDLSNDNVSKKNHNTIAVKYKIDKNRLVEKEDSFMANARELALEVSNQSNNNGDSLSLLKYNHGYLPNHKKTKETAGSLVHATKRQMRMLKDKNTFNQHIKIGNALNEQQIIGGNEEEKKQSFVGGNEKIPDINKYRSDIDSIAEKRNQMHDVIHGRRTCEKGESSDHVLYIQLDGSIDLNGIVSPLKTKNIAMQFVTKNYKTCSLENSLLLNSNLVIINWSKSQVRLFGGARARKTKDLCGFF